MWEVVLVVACLFLAAVMGLMGALLYRHMRRRSSRLSVTGRLKQVRQRIDRVSRLIPLTRDLVYSEFPTIDASAAIEAWLLQDKPKNALVAATQAVGRAPADGRVYLHLARSLLMCGEPDFAGRALTRARELGQESPATAYLEARIRLLLDRAREDADRRPHTPHTLAILELLLDVVEQDPAFGDAAYHAGLLAIDLGLEDQGRMLLRRVRPLMETSAERNQYLKDLERFN